MFVSPNFLSLSLSLSLFFVKIDEGDPTKFLVESSSNILKDKK